MVTISHVVRKYLKESFMLKEYLEEGIINFSALAERLKPIVEKEMDREVKTSAIMMGLRRFAEEFKSKKKDLPSFRDIEILLQTGLCDVTIARSSQVLNLLKQMHDKIDFEKGDTFNLVQGSNEVSVIISQKYRDILLSLVKKQMVYHVENDLVSLTVKFGKDYLYVPGVTSYFLRTLSLEGVNLIEIISSTFETSFIISKKDAVRGYNALTELAMKTQK